MIVGIVASAEPVDADGPAPPEGHTDPYFANVVMLIDASKHVATDANFADVVLLIDASKEPE